MVSDKLRETFLYTLNVKHFSLKCNVIYKVKINHHTISFYENGEFFVRHTLNHWNKFHPDTFEVNISIVNTSLFRLVVGTPKVIK